MLPSMERTHTLLPGGTAGGGGSTRIHPGGHDVGHRRLIPFLCASYIPNAIHRGAGAHHARSRSGAGAGIYTLDPFADSAVRRRAVRMDDSACAAWPARSTCTRARSIEVDLDPYGSNISLQQGWYVKRQ